MQFFENPEKPIDRASDESADDGAVEADELEIRSDGFFEAGGHFLRVPGIDGRDHEFPGLRAEIQGGGENLIAEIGIDALAGGGIGFELPDGR